MEAIITPYQSLPQSKVFIIRIAMIIGSILSLSSTIFVFILYWFFTENRTFILELTIWLSCSVATYSISCLLPYNINNPTGFLWCPIQSFVSNSSLLSQEIWCSILAYCGLVTIIQKQHLEQSKLYYRITFGLLSIALPLILSSLILILNVYGDSDGFCWLDIYNETEKKSLVLKMVLLFFSIDWFIIIINLYFIIKTKLLLRAHPDLKNPIYSYIIWYPIVNSVFALIAITNRLLSLMNLHFNPFALSLIQTIADSSEGCIFMIIFLTSPKFKLSVVMLCNICCRKRRIKNTVNTEYSVNINQISNNDILRDSTLIVVD